MYVHLILFSGHEAHYVVQKYNLLNIYYPILRS